MHFARGDSNGLRTVQALFKHLMLKRGAPPAISAALGSLLRGVVQVPAMLFLAWISAGPHGLRSLGLARRLECGRQARLMSRRSAGLFTRRAPAVHPPFTLLASPLHQPCSRPAPALHPSALHPPCTQPAPASRLPCARPATALHPRCTYRTRAAPTMRMPCTCPAPCPALTLHPPCTRPAPALRLPCTRKAQTLNQTSTQFALALPPSCYHPAPTLLPPCARHPAVLHPPCPLLAPALYPPCTRSAPQPFMRDKCLARAQLKAYLNAASAALAVVAPEKAGCVERVRRRVEALACGGECSSSKCSSNLAPPHVA